MNRDFKKITASPKEIEAMYGIPRGSLANLRWQKKGPGYFKAGGRRVLYRISDVEDWITSQPVQTIDSIEVQR